MSGIIKYRTTNKTTNKTKLKKNLLMKFIAYSSPLKTLSSTDGSNVRRRRNSSLVVDCSSRSDASRAWALSRYATMAVLSYRIFFKMVSIFLFRFFLWVLWFWNLPDLLFLTVNVAPKSWDSDKRNNYSSNPLPIK